MRSWRKGWRPNKRRWAAVRWAVFNRDGWRCVSCGAPGRLECDHRVPIHRMPDDADLYALEGLQTLCRSCHIHKTGAENRAAAAPSGPEAKAWNRLVQESLNADG